MQSVASLAPHRTTDAFDCIGMEGGADAFVPCPIVTAK